MSDQIIDAVMARAPGGCDPNAPAGGMDRDTGRATWPGEFAARLVTDAPTPHVLLADMLTGLRAQVPTGLTRADRQLADPPEVVEVWFPVDAADPDQV